MRSRLVAFGNFRLDTERGEIFDGDEKVALGWRAIAILTLLIERADFPVSREDLILRAWPHSVVEDNNLRVQISAIRKALRESSSEFKFIQNIPGYGYQFCTDGQPVAHVGATKTPCLPSLLVPLVGRHAEIAQISRDMAAHRLITLSGLGGVGKTSLAIAAAHTLTPHYPGGIYFLDLSLVSRDKEAATLLDAYVRGTAPSSAPHMSDADTRGNHTMLLVLDHCEHIAIGISPLIDAIIGAKHSVDFLVTSRVPLSSRHQMHFRIEPLACPPANVFPFSLDEALKYPAAQLFFQRASAASPGFSPRSCDGNALAEICCCLDGLPLAIELAAIRTESIDLRLLSIKLRKSTAFLSNTHTVNGACGYPTLADALESSVVLLSPLEQRVLTRLSIFSARFNGDAAFSVAADPDLAQAEFLAVIESLTIKSLLTRYAADASPVYQIPRAYRGYLHTKLIASAEANAVQQHHAHHLHQRVSRLMPGRMLVGREEIAALYGVVEDIRGALDWCFSTHGDPVIGLELLVSAAYVWCHVSQFSEYVAVGQKALEATAGQADRLAEPRMRLSIALGISIYSVSGATQTMHDLLVSGLNIATIRNDFFWKSLALRGLWKYFHGRSEQEQALTSAKATLQVARAANVGSSHATLKATTYLYAGALNRAKRYLNYAVQISDPRRKAHVTTDQSDQRVFDLCMHARLLWLTGSFSASIEVAEGCLQDVLEKGRPVAIVAALSLAVCPVYCWSDNLDMAEQRLRMLEQYAALYEMDHWSRYGEVFRLGQSLPNENAPDVRTKTNMTQHPWSQRHAEELSVLRGGYVAPALVTRARSDSPIWCSAENLRSYASRRHFQIGTDGERYTQQLARAAVDIARKQGAVGWELRASMTLGRMLEQQDKAREARDLVASVMEKTRGKLITADQRKASAFIEGHSLLDRVF